MLVAEGVSPASPPLVRREVIEEAQSSIRIRRLAPRLTGPSRGETRRLVPRPIPGTSAGLANHTARITSRAGIRGTQLGSGCSQSIPDGTHQFPTRLRRAEKTSCGTKLEPLILTCSPSTGKREGKQTGTRVLSGNEPNWRRLVPVDRRISPVGRYTDRNPRKGPIIRRRRWPIPGHSCAPSAGAAAVYRKINRMFTEARAICNATKRMAGLTKRPNGIAKSSHA